MANFVSFAYLGVHYGDCNDSTPCGAVDVDNSGAVDHNDVSILADDWLGPIVDEPLWFPEWNNPYQCHGDADGQEQGNQKSGYFRVSVEDLAIFTAASWPWPTVYPDFGYNPAADFDRDGDVDDIDTYIILYWFEDPCVPDDCAQPYP